MFVILPDVFSTEHSLARCVPGGRGSMSTVSTVPTGLAVCSSVIGGGGSADVS